MYIPNAYREDDRPTLLAFMRAHSFATLVSVLDGLPFATHVPVVVGERDEGLILTGHLARANPHWRAFEAGETLAIFGGPHAYISPSLYEKVESVPTWNYIAVHAYGPVRVIPAGDSTAALEELLAQLIADHEPAYAAQWEGLSARYRAGMLQGIVGFELAVTRLEGKYKLSQNRSEADQERVAHALAQHPDPSAAALGAAMRERCGLG